jgi:hypothetical protein
MTLPINPELRASLFGSRAFREPIHKTEEPVKETPSVSFADLVRMLAESIADAQASLDRTSAELVTEMANTKIHIIPRVTETIDEDGNIHYEHSPPQEVSLLEIGLTPTFYQFSQATVEVVMDIKIVESQNESGETKGRKGLFAETSSIRFERKLNRDVKTTSKLTATLVPVPMPLRLEPTRTTNVTET